MIAARLTKHLKHLRACSTNFTSLIYFLSFRPCHYYLTINCFSFALFALHCFLLLVCPCIAWNCKLYTFYTFLVRLRRSSCRFPFMPSSILFTFPLLFLRLFLIIIFSKFSALLFLFQRNIPSRSCILLLFYFLVKFSVIKC